MPNKVSMLIGNALHYRQSLDRSRAMRTAWAMSKHTALLRLKRYRQEAVTVHLVRESSPEDTSAVAVMVAVPGRRFFKVWYLPCSTAATWADLVAAGTVGALLERVTGGKNKSLGLVIRLELLAA